MSEKNSRNQSLTMKILVAMVLGAALGLSLKLSPSSSYLRIILLDNVIYITSKLFVSSLKLLVVPMVFLSLVCGVMNLENLGNLKKIGTKTFFLYLATTALAITMAMVLACLSSPGADFHLPAGVSYTQPEAQSVREILASIIPSNPIAAAAEGRMLQLIVFALLFGAGISLAGNSGKKAGELLTELNAIIMKVLEIVVLIMPIGVFSLLCKVFAEQGGEAFKPLAMYFVVVFAALIIQLFIVYPVMIYAFSRLNPFDFLLKIRPVLMFGFSTASSNATIPLTMKTTVEKLGVHQSIAAFTIPLGATINMDGTAIMQGVATVFIAQAYGIDIGAAGYLTVILTATLASIGTAGVPGVGLLTLAMVLKQAGLPVEGIGMIMGVDRLLDMFRTAVNIAGDAAISCIVAQSEGKLNKSVYGRMKTGSV